MAVPAAHADEHFAGTISPSDPIGSFHEPGPGETCGTTGNATVHYSEVDYVSQSSGPRTFVLRPVAAPASNYAFYIYRNGTCIRADYGPHEPADAAAGFVDVSNVVLAKGDHVAVRIIAFSAQSWTLDVLQPGTANAVAAGKGARFVTLPYQVSCGSHKAVVKATGKARKVRSVVFRAGGKKVGFARHLRPGQQIRLKGIPKSATSIKAVVRLKGGGKAKVSRPYSHC
jgi:hypothetical protein